MTDAEIKSVFDDMRARHAVRIVMETLGRAFERLGWAIANERRRR